MHEWMLDNGLTPQLVVDARSDDVEVPRQYVEDGRIVLNVSPSAVRDLCLGNDRVEFVARFGGNPVQVRVAVRQILAIFARENGAGMSFAEQDAVAAGTEDGHDPDHPPTAPGGRPRLKLVK